MDTVTLPQTPALCDCHVIGGRDVELDRMGCSEGTGAGKIPSRILAILADSCLLQNSDVPHERKCCVGGIVIILHFSRSLCERALGTDTHIYANISQLMLKYRYPSTEKGTKDCTTLFKVCLSRLRILRLESCI